MRAVEEEREAERKTERAKLQAAEAKLRAFERDYKEEGSVVGSERERQVAGSPRRPPAPHARSLANVTNQPKGVGQGGQGGRAKPKADGGTLAPSPPSGGYALCEPEPAANASQPTNPSRSGTPRASQGGSPRTRPSPTGQRHSPPIHPTRTGRRWHDAPTEPRQAHREAHPR